MPWEWAGHSRSVCVHVHVYTCTCVSPFLPPSLSPHPTLPLSPSPSLTQAKYETRPDHMDSMHPNLTLSSSDDSLMWALYMSHDCVQSGVWYSHVLSTFQRSQAGLHHRRSGSLWWGNEGSFAYIYKKKQSQKTNQQQHNTTPFFSKKNHNHTWFDTMTLHILSVMLYCTELPRQLSWLSQNHPYACFILHVHVVIKDCHCRQTVKNYMLAFWSCYEEFHACMLSFSGANRPWHRRGATALGSECQKRGEPTCTSSTWTMHPICMHMMYLTLGVHAQQGLQ